MGYCIEMTDSKFEIKKENFDLALSSLKNVFVPENMNCYDYIDGKECPHFSWVDTQSVLNSESLGEALEAIRYRPKYNDNGDVCGIEFTGEKSGCEKIFFGVLAPYVETGSSIGFVGEDGISWEWVFANGTVEQNYITE